MVMNRDHMVKNIDIPVFHGLYPCSWISRVERFLRFDQHTDVEKIQLVSLNLEGEAFSWFKHVSFTNWKDFKSKLYVRFGDVKILSPLVIASDSKVSQLKESVQDSQPFQKQNSPVEENDVTEPDLVQQEALFCNYAKTQWKRTLSTELVAFIDEITVPKEQSPPAMIHVAASSVTGDEFNRVERAQNLMLQQMGNSHYLQEELIQPQRRMKQRDIFKVSNKTMYLEDRHEQKQVMTLISSWNNRKWEPGGVSMEHNKRPWLEKCIPSWKSIGPESVGVVDGVGHEGDERAGTISVMFWGEQERWVGSSTHLDVQLRQKQKTRKESKTWRFKYKQEPNRWSTQGNFLFVTGGEAGNLQGRDYVELSVYSITRDSGLIFPNFEEVLMLQGVLMQRQDPTAYFSKVFTAKEIHKSIHEVNKRVLFNLEDKVGFEGRGIDMCRARKRSG